jgi:S-DNA-T family DNA segregation ATPase FtsK/SpoIIIE
MDIRICFRVRERKDVDLILGQGMLTAGWHAHTLNAPGKFLIAAAEHDTPRRARAYLITDQAVADTANRYADLRPPLDETSRQAIEGRPNAGLPEPDGPAEQENRASSTDGAPEAILWAVLSLAADDGITVPDLMDATHMSRPWIYLRLRELAERGQVVQVSWGRWRAVTGDVP